MDLGISDADLGDHRLFSGIVRDITQRKVAERELTEKTALLEATFESISEGFALFDSDDKMVFCNKVYRDGVGPDARLAAPGVHFEDVIRSLADMGYMAYDGDDVEAKIQKRMAYHREPRGNLELQKNPASGC